MHYVEKMAYMGECPWHGLGARLMPNQPLETWAEEAGMNWQIESADVRFATGRLCPNEDNKYPGQKVLYRSDTNAPLSIVSNRYKVVQPTEVLEFYRDLVQLGGYELETAGVLKGGRKLWALARTPERLTLTGGDTVRAYLLLATACDGTLATTAQCTSIRVVCNNTLAVALGSGVGAVRVPHRTEFSAHEVKEQLGLTIAPWFGFADRARELAACPVDDRVADEYLSRVFILPDAVRAYLATDPSLGPLPSPTTSERAVRRAKALFKGAGKGSSLASAQGSAWGLLNSVTEYVDHHRRARNEDYRRDAAWFGQGAALKQRAYEEALKFVA